MKHYTHKISEISEALLGTTVQIAGWLHNKRDHGGVLFLDIRAFGEKVQVVIEETKMIEEVSKIKLESVLKITGTVRNRPENAVNLGLKSGRVEIVASSVVIENESVQIPFQVNCDDEISEDIRLKYRFLDLRTEKMRNNILLRSSVISYIRKRMELEGFTEFQTPILTASSPEGARDFLVPSRIHPNKFYALPQAPQQFKQLLMMSGFEKYFQIAPCFRDEDARADRSPGEFYQLDIEMSFATQEDVFSAIEPVMYDVFVKFAGNDDFISTRSNYDNSHSVWINLEAIHKMDKNSDSFKKLTKNIEAFYHKFNEGISGIKSTPSEVISHVFNANINMRDEIPLNTLTQTNWDAGFIVTTRDAESVKTIKNRLLEIMFKGVNFGKTVSPYPFKRIPYDVSMLKYGNDKPDLRNPIEIFDASDIFEGSKFGIFASTKAKGDVIRAILVPSHGKSTEYFKTEMQNFAKLNGGEFGLAYMIFEEGTVKNCPIRNAYKIEKNGDAIHEEEFAALVDTIKTAGNLKDGDAVFFACGKPNFAAKLAGLVRTKIGRDLKLINENHFEFCWIVDFPFFEESETEKNADGTPKIEFSHNPFSMPQGGMDVLLLSQEETFDKIFAFTSDKDICWNLSMFSVDIMETMKHFITTNDFHVWAGDDDKDSDVRRKLRNHSIEKFKKKFYINPLTIKAYQYDIVCNGIELSSGAIRNHKLDLMFKAFQIAGYGKTDEETKEIVSEKFAGMVNAFQYGAPPHGGIAPGIDRIVMLLAGTDSIRDIIAFPLNGKAQDLLMNAPSEVGERQLEELRIFTEEQLKNRSESVQKRLKKLGLEIKNDLN